MLDTSYIVGDLFNINCISFAIMNTANQISDWILSKMDREAGDTISPLKLQKLLYYAQAWHYTIFGKRLFDEGIEAWAHGPVVRSQFERFRNIPRYQDIAIEDFNPKPVKLDSKSTKLLEDIMSIYGEHSGKFLEDLTHSESPWIDARGNLLPHEASNEEISLKSMKDFYSQKLKKNNG